MNNCLLSWNLIDAAHRFLSKCRATNISFKRLKTTSLVSTHRLKFSMCKSAPLLTIWVVYICHICQPFDRPVEMWINANSGKRLQMFQRSVITSNEVCSLYTLKEDCRLTRWLINNKLWNSCYLMLINY